MVSIESFDSTERLFATLSTRGVNDAWSGHVRKSLAEGQEKKRFTGTKSWDEALDLARNGYRKPVENMKRLTRDKTLATAERVGVKPSRPISSVVGGSPNVTRAMMGVPRDMRRTVFEKRKMPGVTLVYDMSIPWTVSAAEIERRGTRFLALGNVLGMSNIPVKLVASCALNELRGDGGVVRFDVTLKDFGNVLNIEKCAFYLAHPSFLRRVVFSLIETSSIVTEYEGGYGIALTDDGYLCDKMRQDAKKSGARWFTFSDFDRDDAIEKAYREIKEGR